MLKAPFTVAKAKARVKNFFEVKRTFIDYENYVCYTIALRLYLLGYIPGENGWSLCEKEQV